MVKLIAGNWKMHGTSADLGEVRAIAARAGELGGRVEVALCVPATLIHRAAEAVPGFTIGAQDMHANEKGAHTGDLCASMLHDAGAGIVIVGHSERREAHGEADADVKAKAEAGLRAGLKVILCVGESLAEREAGRAVATVAAQVDASLPQGPVDGARFSLAYEPIWAIGTGRVAGCEDIEEMHAAIRARLVAAYGEAGRGVRILYGGSVKPGNAAEIFATPEVGGALVGGASLTAADFLPIVEAGAA
ncbi:triose-phosphate isomerase [Sphingomonas astaxanthinifaciens]|uniref:Triosephosphate isomerase n=1 Tax=Sphingomonas astaxanthinifaciens DSM 22298 TaxID=1123267 RepID=A0ABQ5Z5I5_9SPHN|nr:triose-phosphate isomerase [Sphingomonas astaxanthinifaciens]GLR48044.1 triosephosphate isomerase [Sphingomonas astaxanthinifaciens DSM 22298]